MLLPKNDQAQSAVVTRSSGNLVKTGSGLLNSIMVTATPATLKVYDGVDNTGTVLVNSFVGVAGVSYPINALVTTGIFVTIAGSNGQATVFYN
jgi:hypothetical protein